MTPLEELDDTTKGLESRHGAGCIDLVVNPYYNGRGSIFIPQTKHESQKTTIYKGTSKQTWKLTIPYPKLSESFIITTFIFSIGLACHLLLSRMESPPSGVTDRTSIQPTACFVCRIPFFPHAGPPVILQNRPKSSVNTCPLNFGIKVVFILKLTTSSFFFLGQHRSTPQPLPKNSSFQRNLGPTSNLQW